MVPEAKAARSRLTGSCGKIGIIPNSREYLYVLGLLRKRCCRLAFLLLILYVIFNVLTLRKLIEIGISEFRENQK